MAAGEEPRDIEVNLGTDIAVRVGEEVRDHLEDVFPASGAVQDIERSIFLGQVGVPAWAVEVG